MTVHAGPAQLGVNLSIESNDYPSGVSRVTVTCVGPHKIAGIGVRAVTARLNTYYGTTLNAAQADGVLAVLSSIKVSSTRVDFGCNTVDKLSLINGLVSDLQTAGAVVAG